MPVCAHSELVCTAQVGIIGCLWHRPLILPYKPTLSIQQPSHPALFSFSSGCWIVQVPLYVLTYCWFNWRNVTEFCDHGKCVIRTYVCVCTYVHTVRTYIRMYMVLLVLFVWSSVFSFVTVTCILYKRTCPNVRTCICSIYLCMSLCVILCILILHVCRSIPVVRSAALPSSGRSMAHQEVLPLRS